jgi:hypothetical protein
MKNGTDMMKNQSLWICILIATFLVSGCLGSSGPKEDEPERTFHSGVFYWEETVELLAQSAPERVTHEFHFPIDDNSITRIRINVTVIDNDPNTQIDQVERIRMWRESGEVEPEIKEASGGATPFETSIKFEYEGNERLFDWWIVEFTVTCSAGEDQWPGPIIWNGVPDTGFIGFVEADYDYYIDPIQEEEF